MSVYWALSLQQAVHPLVLYLLNTFMDWFKPFLQGLTFMVASWAEGFKLSFSVYHFCFKMFHQFSDSLATAAFKWRFSCSIGGRQISKSGHRWLWIFLRGIGAFLSYSFRTAFHLAERSTRMRHKSKFIKLALSFYRSYRQQPQQPRNV